MTRQEWMERLRTAARFMVSGRDSRLYEDERIGYNLVQLAPRADADQRTPRLNILTTTLSEGAAFGGLATLIDLPLQVFAKALAPAGWQVRFINLDTAPAAGDDIGAKYAQRHGIAPDLVSACHGCAAGAPVPVGPGDIFLGSLWHSLPATLPLLRFQQETFGGAPLPYVSLLQDYEAGFHPWSSAFMLARAAYDADWSKALIFNSRELADYYAAQGHESSPSVVFEPVLNHALLKALKAPERPAKERRILFYGRPEQRRNCFYIGRRALEIWAESYSQADRWQVRSIGAAHDPFALANGAECRVLGKLTLEGYADELHRTAVGLSLMASPHPSYPPLEMAHFGALTVTNSFDCKDLGQWHENVTSLDVLDPERVAKALSDACARFDADPEAGLRGQTRKPHYLAGHDDAVLRDIGEMIRGLISGG
ncbi:MAG: hypothetical protein P1U53_03955 [Sulfitobacter sp.]|nr:hypothetical protein [Sulfitobacter sp.]